MSWYSALVWSVVDNKMTKCSHKVTFYCTRITLHNNIMNFIVSHLLCASVSSSFSLDNVLACDSQDRMFNLIYVLAVVVNGVSTFPNGVIWDRYGTRFLRSVSM